MRTLLFLFIMECCAFAQPRYDLLLKCGHVIDAKNGVSALPDVAIARDRIALVAKGIPSSEARKTVDVSSLYVTPGLVDMHEHVFSGSTICRISLGSRRSRRYFHAVFESIPDFAAAASSDNFCLSRHSRITC
jgi:hypothetical protein